MVCDRGSTVEARRHRPRIHRKLGHSGLTGMPVSWPIQELEQVPSQVADLSTPLLERRPESGLPPILKGSVGNAQDAGGFFGAVGEGRHDVVARFIRFRIH